MKIGLIDADIMWRPHAINDRYGNLHPDIFPNLALMKISAYRKAQGDAVSWYNSLEGHYDIVYVSKVFSDTPIDRQVIDASIIICGGTGFQISLIDGQEVYNENVYFDIRSVPVQFAKTLPDEIEHIMPDYSLYNIQDTAYGFLSRGCPRGCSFCHVAAKEGRKSYKVADLSEWWDGQKNIVLMDGNIMACNSWKDLIGQLAASKAKVDINQGIDIRLMTAEKAEYLAAVKLSTIHFAWDRYREKDQVIKGLKLFSRYYFKGKNERHHTQVFTLVNYDTTFDQDLERVYILRDLGYEPYIMIYDKSHAERKYKELQRWVNMRAIFHKVDRFEDYVVTIRKSKK